MQMLEQDCQGYIACVDAVTERDSAGREVGPIALSYIQANLGHFDIRYRNGEVRYVVRKQRAELAPLTNAGTVFKQELDSGRQVYALRGVIGSARAEATVEA